MVAHLQGRCEIIAHYLVRLVNCPTTQSCIGQIASATASNLGQGSKHWPRATRARYAPQICPLAVVSTLTLLFETGPGPLPGLPGPF
jgi:hypothetical protein